MGPTLTDGGEVSMNGCLSTRGVRRQAAKRKMIAKPQRAILNRLLGRLLGEALECFFDPDVSFGKGIENVKRRPRGLFF